MMVIMFLMALVPSVFGGWFFGSSMARALDLGKTGELIAMIIFGGLLWLTFTFT